MDEERWILVAGDPRDGFRYIGPFKSYDEALEHGDNCGANPWWIIRLEQP